MDQWLANIYGTGGADDLEKTAQATLLQKLAEEEGVDLSGLSEDQLSALAQEVLSGEQQVAEEPTEEQLAAQAAEQEQVLAKEAQAKFEEADFLGRVMAHAYTQELEKIASAKEKTAGGHFGGTPRSMGNRLRFGALKAKMKGRAALEDAGKHVRKGVEHVKSHKKAYGAGAAAAGVAAGAGYAAGKRKEASAFEKLAFERAQEILTAVGVDPATGQPINAQPQQQPRIAPPAQRVQAQPQQQEQFDEALNQRALEMLAEAGYDPEEVVGALNAGGEGGQEQMQA